MNEERSKPYTHSGKSNGDPTDRHGRPRLQPGAQMDGGMNAHFRPSAKVRCNARLAPLLLLTTGAVLAVGGATLSTPSLFAAGGRQFLVMTAGGSAKLEARNGDTLVAYTLNRQQQPWHVR